MSEYFGPLFRGIQSIFEGMSISFASMFVTPVTIQYPDVDVRSDKKMREDGYNGALRGMPANYRGLLHVDLDLCLCCHACEKVCPIGCIVVDDVKADKTRIKNPSGKEVPKIKSAIQFDIDFSKCMFCGLCVEPCATDAIYHTTEFVFNKTDRGDLIKRFVSPEERERLLKRAKEVAAEDAAEKAAKAREAAAKKAEEEAKASAASPSGESPVPVKASDPNPPVSSEAKPTDASTPSTPAKSVE